MIKLINLKSNNTGMSADFGRNLQALVLLKFYNL
jgi:hypothetical protein